MIKVVVSGAHGKMGQETCRAVLDDKDLALVGVFDPGHTGEDLVFADDVFKTSGDLKKLIEESKPDVLVDFSTPAVVLENIKLALSLGVHAVVGTTGVSKDDFQKAYEDASDGKAHLFVAP
ncbi:MAG: 4-hydroxy-tetrahydrodipicolinate reductase, partial [Coriobacteriia bacterium]|nr:4-hydroxy-tetrahydrodipicolinate reductase [Coriobacteriia bacterium]